MGPGSSGGMGFSCMNPAGPLVLHHTFFRFFRMKVVFSGQLCIICPLLVVVVPVWSFSRTVLFSWTDRSHWSAILIHCLNPLFWIFAFGLSTLSATLREGTQVGVVIRNTNCTYFWRSWIASIHWWRYCATFGIWGRCLNLLVVTQISRLN